MIIANAKDFDLQQTFECGQCFRWNKLCDDKYIGVVGDFLMGAYYRDGSIIIECENEQLAKEYFDIEKDYSEMKKRLQCDEVMAKAISAGYGIRLLKQQPWETLVSFIISANNNIPRIKKIIELLCQTFGNEIMKDGVKYHTFPSAEALANVDGDALSAIRCGYRDKYIIDAAKKVATGEVCLDDIYSLPADEGREILKKIKGVGDKVADCILLFAYQKYDVFPKDVWIKKVLHKLYFVAEKDIDLFVRQKFGKLCGLAQQYLFYYGRQTL
ncbi:MAG: 8-oxoguanine DNA glycosylase [Firmicutes bacterium]|nr:8-oxoguanine DNA glycosylase [Bacillota bacterium]